MISELLDDYEKIENDNALLKDILSHQSLKNTSKSSFVIKRVLKVVPRSELPVNEVGIMFPENPINVCNVGCGAEEEIKRIIYIDGTMQTDVVNKSDVQTMTEAKIEKKSFKETSMQTEEEESDEEEEETFYESFANVQSIHEDEKTSLIDSPASISSLASSSLYKSVYKLSAKSSKAMLLKTSMELTDLREKNEHQQTSIKEYVDKIDFLENKIIQLNETVQKVNEERDSLIIKFEEANFLNIENEKRISLLKEKIEKLEEIVKEKDLIIKITQNDLNHSVLTERRSKIEIEKLEQEIINLRNEIFNNEIKSNENYLKLRNELDKEKENFNLAILNLESRHEMEKNDLNDRNIKCEEEIEKLKKQIEQLMKFPDFLSSTNSNNKDLSPEEMDLKLENLIKANNLRISLLEEKSKEYRNMRFQYAKSLNTQHEIPLTEPVNLLREKMIINKNIGFEFPSNKPFDQTDDLDERSVPIQQDEWKISSCSTLKLNVVPVVPHPRRNPTTRPRYAHRQYSAKKY
ncbi:hypothetical protein ROZALSC1DRAFT_24052 [Rozella allomycis CSF55]|uniref:Uncharacterized protein n=1 Tax=Rozella allomycis (strain CSF55) TaxID=988480 RepID=A0A4P9YH39_ROZAC|nr:hypothetical protein ROZALSC1DRAFT_24052 [Rozella allomycis CSF55]